MERIKGVDDAAVAGVVIKSLKPIDFEKMEGQLKEDLEIEIKDNKKPLSYYELSNAYLNETNFNMSFI
jgi:hypothetical protein